MKIISIAIAMGGWAWICFTGCQSAREEPGLQGAARATVVRGTVIEVRYRLPNQEALAGKSSAARWGLAAPVEAELANPNLIVYDREYIEKYVDWAATAPIACGPGTYVIVTPQGERSVQSGHEESYLGLRFSAEDFVKFLKTRTAGTPVERTFRINHAESVKVLRDYPESLAAKRLQESPWDRDTRMIIYLLGVVPYEPAYPLIVPLVKDANPAIQYEAIMALGRMAAGVPPAIDELETLLGDESARSTAASALAMAGEPALPAILRSLDHPDWSARNHLVFALGRHADAAVATPALRKVLVHHDAETRECGVAVIVDLITHGGPEEGQPFVAELAARLLEDTNANTRRGAALALLNMKSFAAPAEEALRQAAENERDYSHARDIARKALQELKSEQERAFPAGASKQEASTQGGFDSFASAKDAIRRFYAVRGAVHLAWDPDERPTARRDLLRNCLALVNGALRPNEKKDCIRFGELSVLDRDGECWVVEVDQGLLGTQFGYFDDRGRLLFAWRAPEG